MFKDIIEENNKNSKKEIKSARIVSPFVDNVETRVVETDAGEKTEREPEAEVENKLEISIEPKVTKVLERKKELIEVGKRAIGLGMGVIVVHGVEFEKGVAKCSCKKGVKCSSKGKHPIASGWQNKAVRKEEELEALFKGKGKYNIGLVMGEGLIALDIDGVKGEEDKKELEKELGILPATAMNISANGRHEFYRIPEGMVIKNDTKIQVGELTEKIKGQGLDIRSKGGLVVGPVSRHEKGVLYKWDTNSEQISNCTNLPSEWTNKLITINNSIHSEESKVNRESAKKVEDFGDLEAFVNGIIRIKTAEKAIKIIRDHGVKGIVEGSRDDTMLIFTSSLNGSRAALSDIRAAVDILNSDYFKEPLPEKQIDNHFRLSVYPYRLKNIEGWKEYDLKKGLITEYDIDGNQTSCKKVDEVEEDVVIEEVFIDDSPALTDTERAGGEGVGETKGDDSMTSTIDAGVIRETDQGYVVTRNNKGESYEKLITNFIIEPMHNVFLDNESIMKINLKYIQNNVVKNREVNVCPKIFGSKKSMKEAISMLIGSPAAIGTISTEFEDLCRHITDRVCRSIEGTKTGGIVKHKREWKYALEQGVVDKDMNLDDSLRHIGSLNIVSSDNRNLLLDVKELTEEDKIILRDNIFSFNSRDISALIMGWTAALMVKERLYVDHKVKFPLLGFMGNPEAGKTATVENIIAPLLCIERFNIPNAGSITTFASNFEINKNNVIPFVLDEFNYQNANITKERKGLVSELINISYDRGSLKRGNKDMGVDELKANSPMLLIGENFDLNKAQQHRSILLTLNKGQQNREDFKTLCNNREALNSLGKEILKLSLSISKDKIEELLEVNIGLVKSSCESERQAEGLAVALTGIDLVNIILEIDNVETIKTVAMERYSMDNLGGENASKGKIEEILELINLEASQGNIDAENLYLIRNININGKSYKALCLDFKVLLGSTLPELERRRGRDIGIEPRTFCKLLRLEPYFLNYDAQRFKGVVDKEVAPGRKKFYILDIEKLKEGEIDLDFLYDEAEMI